VLADAYHAGMPDPNDHPSPPPHEDEDRRPDHEVDEDFDPNELARRLVEGDEADWALPVRLPDPRD